MAQRKSNVLESQPESFGRPFEGVAIDNELPFEARAARGDLEEANIRREADERVLPMAPLGKEVVKHFEGEEGGPGSKAEGGDGVRAEGAVGEGDEGRRGE